MRTIAAVMKLSAGVARAVPISRSGLRVDFIMMRALSRYRQIQFAGAFILISE
jgi:hypothetical protein